MSRLEIILSAALLLSMIFNFGVLAYARGAIVRLLYVSEELGDLQNMINSFASHVKSVYELDAFYGDQTLEHLLHHAVSFNEQLETFEYIYSLTEEETNEEYTDNSDETEDTQETQDERDG
tara:strand:+ start:8172 stop:8534 length:363 start_codon:yes stop_codon:yes gene_type:complete